MQKAMGSPLLPPDYLHKIYAGVLGKLIGVYLGRPFENWTYHEILQKLGPINYYVHPHFNVPLVVIDDDVSGTFAFVRTLEEHGAKATLSSEDVGKTWLNQVIEKKTIFWWGGNGISTEHTAFNNLKKGVKPPMSGSITTNGKTLAEQIGAQIFIDAWAMVSPGNPKQAAKLAEAAARVSHDGVAVHAAVLWAVMEAEAFASSDVNHLLDIGLSYIPGDSPLVKLISDIRRWTEEDKDWQKTRQRIENVYGYDKYGGICHMIPNHGIMIMALLYGGQDFSLAMHIINTSGWDTDCNSGNLGCLVAIMHGLAAFDNDGPDWRGPLADRALISSADGGYSVNDAVRITYDLANLAHKLIGEEPLDAPKGGAQWHFSLPGSVQGFETTSPLGTVCIEQGETESSIPALGIHIHDSPSDAGPVEVTTPTFTPADALAVKRDYEMMACPLICPGQLLTATLSTSSTAKVPALISLRLKAYDSHDEPIIVDSPPINLSPGTIQELSWTIPATLQNKPIFQLGVAISPSPAHQPFNGTIWLHSIKYSGAPTATFSRPPLSTSTPGLESRGASFWRHMWVSSVHKAHATMGPSFYLAQDDGEGLFYTGTREWRDYMATASGFEVSLGEGHGVVVRVQGLNRWYAAVLARSEGDGKGVLRVVKARDGERDVLAEGKVGWEVDRKYSVSVSVKGRKICARVGDVEVQAEDGEFSGGAAGFIVGEGCVSAESLAVAPVS